MKSHYKIFLSLAFGLSVGLTGCQDDEVLDLVQYPINQPEITINGEEGESISTIHATYQSNGSLSLDAPVSRTYTFRLKASPEDATVHFDILNTNIPAEKLKLSATDVILPAGLTETSVNVSLQDEDFNFAKDNYDEETYEVGVKATVKGYKIPQDPIESKVIIKKEAYSATCFISAEENQPKAFERTYAKQNILEKDPIAYKFRIKLDKPVRKDVKVKFSTEGIKENFQKDITIVPNEITIPAGEITTDIITWTITNDFLLESTKPENFNITINSNAECEDSVLHVDKEKSALNFNIVKSVRNIGFIDAINNNWKEISKANWNVESITSTYGIESLIDNNGGPHGSGATSYSESFEFIVDMKTAKTISGLAIDYMNSWGSVYSW